MTGLNSVTFRPLNWQQVLRLAQQHHLECIEWGGDIHVPPGDEAHAKAVGQATRKAGLAISSYGSYHRLGSAAGASGAGEAGFAPVLAAAKALGAPLLRVWAGASGSAQTAPEQRAAQTAELAKICQMAAPHNITIGLEYHRNTLTDTAESTLRLLEEANAPNLKTYWQMNPELTHAQRLEEITLLRPHICAVHVFHWSGKNTRHPLGDGAADWRDYLQAIANPSIPYTFEFVLDDTVAQLQQDIESWNRILHRE